MTTFSIATNTNLTPAAQQLADILVSVYFHEVIRNLKAYALEQIQAQAVFDRSLQTFAQSNAETEALRRQLKLTTPTQPKHGDPVDTWLDWRDAERKAGRARTLDYIAQESGFSVHTIKHYSAKRKPRGTKKGTK